MSPGYEQLHIYYHVQQLYFYVALLCLFAHPLPPLSDESNDDDDDVDNYGIHLGSQTDIQLSRVQWTLKEQRVGSIVADKMRICTQKDSHLKLICGGVM